MGKLPTAEEWFDMAWHEVSPGISNVKMRRVMCDRLRADRLAVAQRGYMAAIEDIAQAAERARQYGRSVGAADIRAQSPPDPDRLRRVVEGEE